MTTRKTRRVAFLLILLCGCFASAWAQDDAAITIAGVKPESGNAVSLNSKLLVSLTKGATPLPSPDAAKYVLFLDGHEVQGLPPATYDGTNLVFLLKRIPDNKDNRDLWSSLLGSPSLTQPTRRVAVALGQRLAANASVQPTIAGANATVMLEVFTYTRLIIASLVVLATIWLVIWGAGKSATLRDHFVPQIDPGRQTFSLGRMQMAFWFVLIFCAFVFLYIITWDYNTVSSQSLVLMGISAGTGLAAVTVDVIKDSPADATNRALQALGFNSFEDVQKARLDVATRTIIIDQKQTALLAVSSKLAAGAPLTPQEMLASQTLPAEITALALTNTDWNNRLNMYEAKIRPFVSSNWFRDITTDLNGSAVHRVQVFCWTVALGVVFLIGVYRNLSMPEFNDTLLALMAISSAGYVGFKLPEKGS